MTRGERRYRRILKIKQRVTLVNTLGLQQGTLYEKHRNKLKVSYGYLSKGNVKQFVSVHPRREYKRVKKCLVFYQ